MRKLLIAVCMLCLFAVPVNAADFQAPEVPQTAQRFMPDDTENFGQGLWYVVRSAIQTLQPSIAEACTACAATVAAAIVVGIFTNLSDSHKPVVEMIGAIVISIQLYQPSNALIQLGADTVYEINQYGKLLLPVMSGALAAQGAISKSASLYTATVFIDALLSTAVTELLVPLLYIFLSIAIVCSIFKEEILNNIQSFIKWLCTWGLKTVLYVFIGYIGITGVVSGTTDAAALKATKLTISGMVPVVGGIISDASDAVLASAGLVKNTVGIYGLLAIAAIWIGPFLQIGVEYLLLKMAAGICEMLGVKGISQAVKGFSEVMGILLAMVGTVSLILMISTVCFIKGVG